jgi:hypothetical protein
MSSRYLVATTLVALAAFATPALAEKGGKGPNSGTSTAAATCAVSNGLVQGSGLPTDEVVNFMIRDASGTTGWVLGYTWDGTFTVRVPEASTPTTYEFVSRTSGPGGSRYTVFASCS